MNKTIIGVVVAILLIIGAIFIIKEKDRPITLENTPGSSPKSMMDLLAQNKSQKCTFSDSTEVSKNSGTTYFGNGEIRGDFISETSAGTFNSHMILKGDDIYVWQDKMNKGFKMKAFTINETEYGNNNSTPNLDQKVDYDCNDWNPDQSFFELPNITFNDMSQLIHTDAGVNSGIPKDPTNSEIKAIQCKVCDQSLDEASKAQCKAALACN